MSQFSPRPARASLLKRVLRRLASFLGGGDPSDSAGSQPPTTLAMPPAAQLIPNAPPSPAGQPSEPGPSQPAAIGEGPVPPTMEQAIVEMFSGLLTWQLEERQRELERTVEAYTAEGRTPPELVVDELRFISGEIWRREHEG